MPITSPPPVRTCPPSLAAGGRVVGVPRQRRTALEKAAGPCHADLLFALCQLGDPRLVTGPVIVATCQMLAPEAGAHVEGCVTDVIVALGAQANPRAAHPPTKALTDAAQKRCLRRQPLPVAMRERQPGAGPSDPSRGKGGCKTRELLAPWHLTSGSADSRNDARRRRPSVSRTGRGLDA